MKTISLKVEYKDHDKVVLTNPNGDTYTSTSEDFMDFLHGAKENTLPIADTQSACKHDYVKTGLEGELYCYKCDSPLPIADIDGKEGQKEADWELMTKQIIDVLEEANGTGSGAYDVIEFLKAQPLPSNEKQYSREDVPARIHDTRP